MNEPEFVNCPGCGERVAATEREQHWGVKCPKCGVGFIPKDRSPRVPARREGREIKAIAVTFCVMAVVLLVVFVGGAMGLATMFWGLLALAVVGLLAGILFQVVKMNRRAAK